MRFHVVTDSSRNANLTEFGKQTLKDRYLLPGEDFQDLFARVASAYADDEAHAQRLYDYMSTLWFMPATPVLANGGTTRALPVSCFVLSVPDSITGIIDSWAESALLGARGGGLGVYYGNVRSIGESVGNDGGQTSGVIPFMKVQDSLSLAISQGNVRRSAAAAYLPIDHPEIEEFIEIRKPTGGDPNRRSLNLHHAVIVTDAFMNAVAADENWNLVSPRDGRVVKTVKARELWIKILTMRVEQGEPYLMFRDTVNRNKPEVYKLQNHDIETSQLCNEIFLKTGEDQHGIHRTAICCLSSLNIETYPEWKDDPRFIEDVMRFLDNVLEDFILRSDPQMKNSRYSAMRERSVGLGVMGFHSFLQSKNVPFESPSAIAWNKRIFKHIQDGANAASRKLAEERGPCPDAAEVGLMERFSNKTAVAPTASISIIAGGSSPGIEPSVSNSFSHKTLSGTHTVRNPHLKRVLASHGRDDAETWTSIAVNKGSVQHLDFLTDWEKLVFKTAFEIDQMWLVQHGADRQPFIDQGQSLNLFFHADVDKKTLNQVHMAAWKKGLKGLYYCRSMALHRAETVSAKVEAAPVKNANNGEECAVCQ